MNVGPVFAAVAWDVRELRACYIFYLVFKKQLKRFRRL